MKKSKIIVPALALIAFSMAASITGSVAWFTANRQASIDAGTYTVVKTTANLDNTVTGGIGTEVVSGAVVCQTTVSSSAIANVLTDGSFDHLTGNVYTPKSDLSGADATALSTAKTTPSSLERATLSTGGKVYTAVSFHVQFSVTFASASNDIALYLDASACTFTVASGANDSATGFRMAFYSTDTNAVSKVIAPLQTAANCKYVDASVAAAALVSGNPATNQGTAYDGDLMDSAYFASPTAMPTDGSLNATQAAARVDYLGKFAYAVGSPVTLDYDVVTWFEGSDPNVDNDAVLQSVTAVLGFKAFNIALPSA